MPRKTPKASATAAIWRDASSYEHGQRGVVEPTAWSLDLADGVRVVVHRWRGLAGWHVTCPALRVDTEQLKSESGMAARQEAIELLRRRARVIAEVLSVDVKEPA
ncbi:MAG TPA: hypothetical protein VFO62_10490 [Candidatus Binatia bacterium]|nr:hypothetical protein [Candidatus Binatia bacterium]